MSPVSITCAEDGCPEQLEPDSRHLANLQAAGWRCPEHRRRNA